MATVFDFATVACFLGLVGAFFLLTTRRPRTLLHLLLSGIAFAVANQLGNAGYGLSAVILIIAGIGYAVIIVRAEKAD
jgi:lysozyme family protein